MEGSTELITNSIVTNEEPECMEITPVIDTDFMDAAASSLLADSSAPNPYTEQMLKDGLSYADIDYFIKSYSNISNVKFEKVHCTCCNKHVGTAIETTERYAHPLLQVIVCENCYMFYCSGEFETDQDGSELYCRWCGEGGQVFCCSKCPYVFCRKCISRNLGKGMAPEIECMEDWLCFHCNPCQISKQRAICWAINKYAQESKELSEFSPHLQSQLFLDYSTCCKSKRALAKAGLLPAPKRAKTDGSKLKQALQKEVPDVSEIQEVLTPALVWENTAEPQDEVICTPDIMPFEESPPSSPPHMLPMEYAPPPGLRGLDAPPNVPVVKRLILPKPTPPSKNPPKEKPAPIVKVVPPKPAPIKTPTNINKTPNQNTSNRTPTTTTTNKTPATSNKTPVTANRTTPNINRNNNININKNPPKSEVNVTNVVPTTQKITVPVQKGNTNSDEQWFGTAVIRSAEVTEYISSKVSLLAFMNSSNDVTDEKREEIYRTFQSHLDIAIAKLKNIKQNMTSSYKRLLNKQAAGGNQIKVQPMVIKPTVVQTVTIPRATTPVKTINKPLRTSARKKSINYIESSSEDEDWKQSDSDEEYSSGSNRKRYRRKKPTPKKVEAPNFRTVELVKPVDIKTIVNSADTKTITPTIRDNKIILDVIDLVDDDSNDADLLKKDEDNLKSLSDIEREEVPEIDSDISEILPDHLVDDKDSDDEEAPALTKKHNESIEIDDEGNKSDLGKNKTDICKTQSSNNEIAPIEIDDDDDDDDDDDVQIDKEVIKADCKTIEEDKDHVRDALVTEEDDKEDKIVDQVKEVSEDKISDNEKKESGDEKKESEDAKMDNESQSSLLESKNNVNEKNIDKMESEDIDNSSDIEDKPSSGNKRSEIENYDDLNTNETNATEEELEIASENKSPELENIDDTNETNTTEENSDSMPKTDRDNQSKCQNGEHDDVENNMSDNAVDGEMEKNGDDKSNNLKKDKGKQVPEEDFEDFLSSSIITSKKTVKDNFGAEFSKFVTNSKSSISDEELDDDIVGNMCEETDDALSEPPQNTLDFALGLNEKEEKREKRDTKTELKNGSEQNAEEIPFDNELNVLRKLAENCISGDIPTNDSNVC